MPTLLVIIASTRPGRVGGPVGDWFADQARDHAGFDVDVADLAELALPFLDEPNHPRLADYEHDHTKAWSERVTAADAVVMVTPEYNHSFPATLKNAIDFLHNEWKHKPVGFITYGGVSGGTRAMTALEPVVGAVGMVALPVAVNIPFVFQFLDEGRFVPNEPTEKAAAALLDALASWHGTLSPRRAG